MGTMFTTGNNLLYATGAAITSTGSAIGGKVGEIGGLVLSKFDNNTSSEKEITSLGPVKAVIFDLGKVLIRTNYRNMIYRFQTSTLLGATCLERRKLTELKPLLFSLMEAVHGKGKLTPHLPALFEDWMTNSKTNEEIMRILENDISQCRHIGRYQDVVINLSQGHVYTRGICKHHGVTFWSKIAKHVTG